MFKGKLPKRAFSGDTGVGYNLPIKLCNALILRYLYCIHIIPELFTITEKEAVKQLYGTAKNALRQTLPIRSMFAKIDAIFRTTKCLIKIFHETFLQIR